MNLHSQNVDAIHQVKRYWILIQQRLVVSNNFRIGECVGINGTFGHIATQNLLSIQIHNGTVIASQAKQAIQIIGCFSRKIKGFPEIGCCVLIKSIASVRNYGGFISIPVSKLSIPR